MTGVPPLAAPDVQVIAILVASVLDPTYERLTGASGLVRMTAPLPALD